MGTYTLEQMKDKIRKNLANRTDLDGDLTDYINLAQIRIARARDFKEMRKLTALSIPFTGDPTTDRLLVLADNFRSLFGIRLLDGSLSRRLISMTQFHFDNVAPRPEEFTWTGPTHYNLWGKTLEFVPPPDKAYNALQRWSAWPTALSATDSKSDLSEKDDMITALATHISFKRLGKREEAASYFAEYKDMLKDAIKEDVATPDLTIQAFSADETGAGTYWADPFAKSAP